MHADLKLGELIQGEQHRDAIHVAVAPVIAGETLEPGQRIGLNLEGEAVATRSPVVGIVDPFLRGTVRKGEKFWLFLMPNTVTGMRHEWQHPAFSAKDKTPEMHTSESWLRQYAKRVNSNESPEDAFTYLLDDIRSGELLFRGTDLHGLYELDDADELRHHAETYLGIRIDWERFTFSCSC